MFVSNFTSSFFFALESDLKPISNDIHLRCCLIDWHIVSVQVPVIIEVQYWLIFVNAWQKLQIYLKTSHGVRMLSHLRQNEQQLYVYKVKWSTTVQQKLTLIKRLWYMTFHPGRMIIHQINSQVWMPVVQNLKRTSIFSLKIQSTV